VSAPGLSADQQEAVDRITTWFRGGALAPFVCGGLAGTGKTWLASRVPGILGVQAEFTAPTGRAALMINLKGRADNPPRDTGARTIHQVFYAPVEIEACRLSDEKPGDDGRCWVHPADRGYPACATYPSVRYDRRQKPRVDKGTGLLIVDEGSMVDGDMWELISSCGIPVLAFGDHGQLEPVRSGFSLMEHPDTRLETILRQAEGSPITRLAHWAREHGTTGGYWADDAGEAGFAEKISYRTLRGRGGISADTQPDDMIICWKNRTRLAHTGQVRKDRGLPPWPVPGDKVIALRNNWQQGVVNGERGDLVSCGYPFCIGVLPVPHKDHADCRCSSRHQDHRECECMLLYPVSAVFEGGGGLPWSGHALSCQFGSQADFAREALFDARGTYRERVPAGALLIDYGYVLTCHKAQGGQAARVVVTDESWRDDKRRLLYTAITRAERSLTIVGA
jgi:exodeoxyribonuclease V